MKEQKSMQIRHTVILSFVFLYLCFPIYCFALMIRSGANLQKYFFALPSFRLDGTLTNGVFLLWPLAIVILWAALRSPWVRKGFSALLTRENFKVGWKILLFLAAYYAVFSLIQIKFRKAIALILLIPALGLFSGYLNLRLRKSFVGVFKLGWGVLWRATVFHWISGMFIFVVNFLLMYISIWPGLAMAEVLGKGGISLADALRKMNMLGPAYTPWVHFFVKCDWLILVGTSSLLFLAGLVFIPGLAFWRTVRKLGYGDD
ncbi:MAG: hypothetical protein HY587_06815 [Candidatus Omnitrophica bacterium]|nr:hypothetical protein [Candidatus Omnitrophota bacterium]